MKRAPWKNRIGRVDAWELLDQVVLLSLAAGAMGAALYFLFTPAALLAGIILVPAALVLVWIALYEGRAERGAQVTRVERVLAHAWLWTRRGLLGLVAAVWFSLAWWCATSAEASLAGAAAFAALGMVALWVGIVGAGRHKNVADDLAVHRERKARYGWWL